MSFKDDLAAAKETVGDRVVTPEIPVAINGHEYKLIFIRASTVDWPLATQKHLPRPLVELDRKNGYNLSGVTRELAPTYGRIVEDDESETELTVEEWADFWEAMAPATARTIEANVWYLHEHDAEQEILRAKKASSPRRTSRKKPS